MSILGNNLFAAYYEQNANPYKKYEGYDIAIEIQTTPEQLEWGINLRKNVGTLTINWGDEVEEVVTVTSLTTVTHIYPSAKRYVMYIADASRINAGYSRIGNLTTYSPMVTRVIKWEVSNANFQGCSNAVITELSSVVTSFTLYDCVKATVRHIPSGVDVLNADILRHCVKIKEIVFDGTPSSIDYRAFRLSSLEKIYVPWSENDAINTNAPWNAPSNVQIIYNYTP